MVNNHQVGLCISAHRKQTKVPMAVDTNVPDFFDRLFSRLFDLKLQSIESVRPLHKKHGGW